MVDFAATGQRLTDIRSKSFDASTRAITYVAATDRPITRKVSLGGKDVTIQEILPPEACVNINEVDQTPILDNHNDRDRNDHLGTQRRAWIEDLGGGVRGVVVQGEMFERPDVMEMDRDIAAGRISKMSAGYRILDASVDKSTMPWTVTAKAWRLRETSFTPNPADTRASVRSLITTPQETKMDPVKLEALLSTALSSFSSTILDAVRKEAGTTTTTSTETETDEQKQKRMAAEKTAADKKRDEGMSDDERKRSEVVADMRKALGARKSEEFEIAVRNDAPVDVIRATAWAAISASPATRTIVPPADTVDAGNGLRRETVTLGDFGVGTRREDIGAIVNKALTDALAARK